MSETGTALCGTRPAENHPFRRFHSFGHPSAREVVAQIDPLRAWNALAQELRLPPERYRGVDAKPPEKILVRIAVEARYVRHHQRPRIGPTARQIRPPHIVEVV